VGIFGVVLIAVHLAAANKAKKPKAPEPVTCGAIGLGNPTPDMVQIDKAMLTDILRAYGADRYFELPLPRTRQ
jgi:hypothetical protein